MKRSGRDESVWVVTHLGMEAMLGISLYSCLIIAYVYSSTKLEKRAEQVLPGSEGSVGRKGGDSGEKWPKQCMHI
jgi:hypothetical protein